MPRCLAKRLARWLCPQVGADDRNDRARQLPLNPAKQFERFAIFEASCDRPVMSGADELAGEDDLRCQHGARPVEGSHRLSSFEYVDDAIAFKEQVGLVSKPHRHRHFLSHSGRAAPLHESRPQDRSLIVRQLHQNAVSAAIVHRGIVARSTAPPHVDRGRNAAKWRCPKLVCDMSSGGHDGVVKDPESLVGVVATVVPLRIVEMHSHPPVLTVLGEGWSLHLAGRWTWRRHGSVIADGGKSGTDELWALCGLSVLRVRLLDASCSSDCAFDLSDGGSLETRSDRTDHATWTLRHEDLAQVLIGR